MALQRSNQNNRQQYKRQGIDKIASSPSLQHRMKHLLPGLFVLPLALSSLSSGAIIFTGNFQTGTATVDTPTMTITAPLVFTIPSGASVGWLIFDEMMTGASAPTVVDTPSQSLSYQLDGSSLATIDITSFRTRYGATVAGLTPNDGVLRFSDINVTGTNRTLTIPAGQTFTFASNANMVQPPASFSGNLFLLDSSGMQISNIVAVPEPSTSLLGTLGALGLLRRRR